MLARIVLLARKEAWHILRDFRTIYMAFGIPLVLLGLFGYALTMDIEKIPTVIVDQDHSRASRDIIGQLQHAGYFLVVARSGDPGAILPAFRTNKAKAAFIVPPRFGRALSRGEKPAVQLLVDGTDANVAAIAMGYASAITAASNAHLVAGRLQRLGMSTTGLGSGLVLKSRNWFNPDLKSQWYLVPGLIAVIMAMMAAILMALTVAREWEDGTMEQLLMTPVRPIEIVVGKLIPYFVIGLGQLTLVAFAGVLLFHVPIRGSLLLLYGLGGLFLVGALSQGLLISIVTRQQQVAMQLSLMSSLLPAMLLSGFLSPIASMPPIIAAFTHVIPARYFLVIARGIFLKGSGLGDLLPEVVALGIFATAMLTLAVSRFKTRLD